MRPRTWRVTRRDHEVRVDVTDSASFDPADTQAILDAVVDYLDTDGLTTVRFDGTAIDAYPVPKKFATVIARLSGLVQRRGLRFHMGPI